MSRGSRTWDSSCSAHQARGICLALAIASILPAGCGIGSTRKDPLELKVRDLTREKAELAADLERCRIEAAQLQQRVAAMAALPQDGRPNPYKLTSIRISGFTGFYDKDEDGTHEKLLVYLQPVDENGDIVKAAGTVSVRLWNLDDPGERAVVGQWEVQPLQLRTLWFSALVSSYRLPFDAPVTPELLARPLTVQVAFTDYLTGETFHDQHVIKPRPQ